MRNQTFIGERWTAAFGETEPPWTPEPDRQLLSDLASRGLCPAGAEWPFRAIRYPRLGSPQHRRDRPAYLDASAGKRLSGCAAARIFLQKMKLHSAILIALLVVSACVHADQKAYREVSVHELVAQSRAYDGQRVRVRGYLVSIGAGAQLVDEALRDCYGNEPSRLFVTTSLPRSILGEWDGSYPQYEGRLVTVVGVFHDSPSPWPRERTIRGSPGAEAVGPVRNARIETISDAHCRRIGENE